MVHFKRKAIRYVEPPPQMDDNVEVWGIEETGEVFTDYESYLQRRDYYNQKRFTCDITGHTNLTYFQALSSELSGSRALEVNFPEPLWEPVLRRVQFSQTHRLDDLVNEVHDQFKYDFFPGEQVIAITPNEQRLEGTIRDKVSFPPQHGVDGTVIRPPSSNYFVQLRKGVDAHGKPIEVESFFDNAHLTRDRKVFSKLLLRAFFKHALTREPHHNAVWMVKEHIANEYKINTELPPHLQPHVLAEKKRLAAQHMRGVREQYFFVHGGPADPNAAHAVIRPGPKGRGHKVQMRNMPIPFVPYQSGGLPPQEGVPSQPGLPGIHPLGHPNGVQFREWQSLAPSEPPPKAAPIIIKYPIEDLEVPPRNSGLRRPPLKFLAESKPRSLADANDGSETDGNKLQMDSVGLLLETWNTLNVHEDLFLLEPFTFDDFVEAMKFRSEDVECLLCTEVHCAILKQLVSPDGQLLVNLPELEEPLTEESEEESEQASPEPEAPPARITRGSVRKSEAERLRQEETPPPDPNKPIHRADEMLASYPWIDRLKVRDFSKGGWQVIIVGVLRQLAFDERQKSKCDAILRELAPLDAEPTQETARFMYSRMDVNLKIQALQTISLLAVTTRAIREYLIEQSESMTVTRKVKIDCQREKRKHVEELRELDEQRRELEAEEKPKEPEAGEVNGNATAPEPPADAEGADRASTEPARTSLGSEDAEVNSEGSSSSEAEEDEVPRRSLRGGQQRKRKREQGNARREKEKRLKADVKAAASAQPKMSAKMKKLTRDIDKLKSKIKDCEDKIAEAERKLREANCQRTKLLGKDRFSNRYWWFERNGMPFDGSSEHGYANGRIWLQGPDDMERCGFLELSADEMAAYKAHMGVDIPERRALEEGETRLHDAREWGFLDAPEHVDALIGWLDERGKREKELRKELCHWKDTIATYMRNLQAHLADAAARRLARDEEAAATTTRVSTRNRTYVDVDESRWGCLRWENTRALRELGHLHCEQPRPRGAKKAAAAKGAAAAAADRAVRGRSGRPLTRQGLR